MIHPPVEQAANLKAHAAIAHGFFGRRCGNGSSGPGLNSSDLFGDDAAQNRRIALTTLGLATAPLARLKQVHSADVVTLTAPPEPGATPTADALVTNHKHIALGILTADCTPVLFADAEAGVIGACHAGWKGAISGIIANTLSAMTTLGADPSRITAAIGPTISGDNYEVGPEFAAELIARDRAAKPFVFLPENGAREHFDLPGFVTAQLQRSGVSSIEIAGACTYANPGRYFSHRHTTHHGSGPGRQISIVAIK